MSTDKASTVNTPGGTISLKRYPRRRGEHKLAWNSADLLLLGYAAASGIAPANTLAINDEFGALAVSLGAECCVWSDSALARLALCQNAELNGLKPPRLIPVTETPAGDFSLVLLRVPKQLSLFRYQLQILRESLAEGTLVVCGGMDKHLPRTLADTLEEFLGETERHRGERKARLFSVRVDKSCSATEVQGRQYFCEELGLQISSRPNVFSAAQLDIGTRALLEQMSRLPAVERVADLGCGSGVLGLAALQRNPQTVVDFIDESGLALASARDNVAALFPQCLARCGFHWADGFEDYGGKAPGLVLCNPPFHQQHAVDDYSGRRLLEQSARLLEDGGELWLVANRHLPYSKTLAQHFTAVDRLSETSKFIVWRAVKG